MDSGPKWQNLSIKQRKRPSLVRIIHAPYFIFTLIASMLAIILFGLGIFIHNTRAADGGAINTTVALDYATFAGAPNKEQPGLNSWKGIPYAKPPLGNLRFAAPQDPDHNATVQQVTEDKPGCLGMNATIGPGAAEDCLYLSVYAPSNVTADSKLPVYVYIPGGGFNLGHGTNQDMSKIIAASNGSVIGVTLAYRVAHFGFLASQEIHDAKDASVNNGLKDVYKALQWIHKYIDKFGGDSERVTITGGSAGGAAVTFMMTAYGGQGNDSLFHSVIGESASFAAVLDIPGSQYQYDNLTAEAGCNHTSDTLACLRKVDAQKLQDVSIARPFPTSDRAPVYMYNPVIDGDMVRKPTLQAFKDGEFVKVPAIIGNVQNEGSIFTPENITNSTEGFNFLRDQFPLLNETHRAKYNDLWFNGTPEGPDFWQSVSHSYGLTRYQCTGYFLSMLLAAKGVPSYHYNYNVPGLPVTPISKALGVTHGSESAPLFATNLKPGSQFAPGGADANFVPLIQNYWLNFVINQDPNNGTSSGATQWGTWDAEKQELLNFEPDNIKMMNFDDPMHGRLKRCQWLSTIAIDIGQ